MSQHDTFMRTRKKSHRRLDADDLAYEAEDHDYYRSFFDEEDEDAPGGDGPPEGDRWSIWDQSEPLERGPKPYPEWLVTEAAAVDHELGILKTGKEADVFLLERAVPGTDRSCLLAAKRYRSSEHSMFRRNDGYLEGRSVRDSRESRAMANRTQFGKEAIAGRWANAEFDALRRMFEAGVAVPYPVQIFGTEILMEFIGEPDGTAAPRLAQLRPDATELADLWRQLSDSLSIMARDGFAHGDLSAYNVIVQDGRLVIIDVPQIIDVIANPRGAEFLRRDVRNIGNWFKARGLPEEQVEELAEELCRDARIH
ncbi:RIO kinase 1 [Stackebrandtia albiflava]|uniref:non-specific serine/threonine protein kinase n=1 Tax=Stackebrandtia albiflava TaxID=406432 RepID=A0A562UYC2_9ACTN|nr:RIO1 family regulatory kinase/ATPase [Stackebrandtia albiflava]TWJ10640.1 RIO kinase 1 [Stackebrandtia albiflava]